MPNGNEIMNAIAFEKKLIELQGDDLSRFIARTLYKHCEGEILQESRIIELESQNKRMFGAVGGASGVIGAIIIAVIDYLMRRS